MNVGEQNLMRDEFRAAMHRAGTAGNPVLEVGLVYCVKHQTMGEFSARVLGADGGHVAVEIVEGYARRNGGGVYGVGEQFFVLKTRATWQVMD